MVDLKPTFFRSGIHTGSSLSTPKKALISLCKFSSGWDTLLILLPNSTKLAKAAGLWTKSVLVGWSELKDPPSTRRLWSMPSYYSVGRTTTDKNCQLPNLCRKVRAHTVAHFWRQIWNFRFSEKEEIGIGGGGWENASEKIPEISSLPLTRWRYHIHSSFFLKPLHKSLTESPQNHPSPFPLSLSRSFDAVFKFLVEFSLRRRRKVGDFFSQCASTRIPPLQSLPHYLG